MQKLCLQHDRMSQWDSKRKYCFFALSIQWSAFPSYPADVRVSAWWQRWHRHLQVGKHVISGPTDFAWLPQEIAEAFCLPALQLEPNCQYGTLGSCISTHSPGSVITVDQIYFIDDSCSASELEVFTFPHVPLVPSSRTLLFSDAVKLLKFAMECDSCGTNNVAEESNATQINIFSPPSAHSCWLCSKARQISPSVVFLVLAKRGLPPSWCWPACL